MGMTIRNLPDEIHRILKREAKRKGHSLRAEIIEIFTRHAGDFERSRRTRLALKRGDWQV
jgi:plasmid stability protein